MDLRDACFMCNGEIVGGFVGGDEKIGFSDSTFKEKLVNIVARRRLHNQLVRTEIYFCDACASLLLEITLCEVKLYALQAGVRGVFNAAEEARSNSKIGAGPLVSYLFTTSQGMITNLLALLQLY